MVTPPAAAAKKPKAPKLSYKDQRDLEQLPLRIEELEQQISAMHESMGSAAFYQKDKDEIAATQDALAKLEQELEETFTRWEALES